MNHRLPLFLLLSVGGFVTPGRTAEPKAAETKPSFSGQWTLDVAASDDAGARMTDAMGERRGRGGFMGVPDGRSGGGGPLGGGGGPVGSGPGGAGMPGFGAPPSREQVETMKLAMDDVLHPAEDLLVSQDGVSFEVVNDGDRVVRLYADGRKNRGSTGIDKKTRWEADKLVTESKVATSFGAAVRITETWALVDAPASPAGAEGAEGSPSEGRRLAIITRLEGGPFEKAVVIRRLYARSGRT